MPHVLVNLAYAKGCLVKRPFDSKEAAESLNPEDFGVYLCPYCNKWHRTSKPHFKQKRIARQKQEKQRRKAKAMKRKLTFKRYEQ